MAGLEPLATLVQGRFSGARVTWSRVVGRALADESVCLGVDRAGRLRVAAVNGSTRNEIAARDEDVLSVYNAEATRLRRPTASALLCFVDDGRNFGGADGEQPAEAPSRRQASPAPDPTVVRDIQALGLNVPDATRDALARVLAGRRARAQKQGDTDASR